MILRLLLALGLVSVASAQHAAVPPAPAGCTTRTEGGFTFDDRWTFNAAALGAPWCVTRVSPADDGSGRVAISARHHQYWAGIVTILDKAGKRTGTFVNAGWIDDVRWFAPDRLVIAGFSAVADAGMVALLDATALDGQSPEDPGAFRCDACGPNTPLRYLVVPRSEVNKATNSPINRARLDPPAGAIFARTIEVPASGNGEAIEAFFELSPALEVRRAEFDGRYWQMRDRLIIEGRMKNERAAERVGPAELWTWDRQAGWQALRIK